MAIPLWTRGDLNAFFGLGINMLVNVLVLAGLAVGVVNIPAHDVYRVILPALGVELLLRNRGIDKLIVTGVTTEVCVHTTVREANDRGFECLVLSDCVGSYFPEFQEVGLKMIAAQGGIFGWVAPSTALLEQLPVPTTTVS